MIKVRLNPDETFRVISWEPYCYIFWWKTIRHFETVKETKAYIRELGKTDKSRLDIKADAFHKLYVL